MERWQEIREKCIKDVWLALPLSCWILSVAIRGHCKGLQAHHFLNKRYLAQFVTGKTIGLKFKNFLSVLNCKLNFCSDTMQISLPDGCTWSQPPAQETDSRLHSWLSATADLTCQSTHRYSLCSLCGYTLQKIQNAYMFVEIYFFFNTKIITLSFQSIVLNWWISVSPFVFLDTCMVNIIPVVTVIIKPLISKYEGLNVLQLI